MVCLFGRIGPIVFVAISCFIVFLTSRCDALKGKLYSFASSVRSSESKLTAVQNIFGDSLIDCRGFSLNDVKFFELCGSYGDLNSMPSSKVPEVAFVGRSNVGKSSLLNAMTSQRKKIAVEGRTPGTTKTINLYRCEDKIGPICSFVDLPGYGFAKISSARQSVISSFLRDYLIARSALKLVILLIDSRREPSCEDRKMLEVLPV